MATVNQPVKEKVSSIINARNNAIYPMTWMANEDDASSGATIGGLASHYNSKLNIYAIQSYIDSASGAVTPADNVFGDLAYNKATVNTMNYTPRAYEPTDPEGTVYYDEDDNTLFVKTGISNYTHRVGRDTSARCKNCSGQTLNKGDIVELRGDVVATPYPCVRLADARRYEENWVLAVVAEDGIVDGDFAECVFQGVIDGINTSTWTIDTPMYLSNTPGLIDDERPTFPSDPFFIGTVLISDAVNGRLGINVQREKFSYIYEGCVLERQSVEIFSNGTNVYYYVANQDNPTINLPVQIGNKIYRLNTTTGDGPSGEARIELTAGTVASPQINYIVARISGGEAVLSAETTRPTGVFAYIGSCAVQTAAAVQTNGAMKHRRHTDAIFHNGRGRISYVDERLRALGSTFDTGMESTIQINIASAPDTVTGTVAVGTAYQLHIQSTPAFSIATDGVYVANASGSGTLTQYQKVFDLGLLLETITGSSLAGLRFNLVLAQVVNASAGECKLIANLPTAGYTSNTEAYYDINNTAITSVPNELRDCAVLLCRIPLRHKTTGGGEFTFVGTEIGGLPDVVDLRGNIIGQSGSSASGFTTVFQDSNFRIFDDGDETKRAAFDASAITTATTRTFTFPDVNDILVTRNTIIAPTSAAGLPSGALWNNGGVATFVP